MVTVATRNFRTVDRVLEAPSPGFDSMVKELDASNARMFLRYLASELNRWYFETWEWCQLALGPALLALIYWSPLYGSQARQRLPLVLALLMFAIVAVERFALTPEIIRIGRLIDFAGPEALDQRTIFWRYHHWYSGLEVTKILLAVALTAIVLRRGPHDR